uniref:hypothetical protein n=1 Tax=Paractinoplanes polyasparticus TaxID=2856853 RepID=UPI001C85B5CC|nr:hypothetical protein [Actinoplanes polyasparticus]
MTDVLQLVSGDDVLDTVTFTGDEITYATGEARSLIESRLKLIPDRVQALRSLVGWSNGYVTVRAVLPDRFVEVAPEVEVQAAAGDADARRLQEQWDKAKARLLRRWPKLAAKMVTELADQAEAAIEAGDVAALAELEVSAGVVAAVAVPIRKTGTDLAAEAAAGVVEEAAAQDVSITAPSEPGADRVRQHADVVARIIANGYASGAARTALQLAGAGPQEVRDEVERHLTELSQSTNGLVGTEIGGLLSAAQHAGRLAVLEQQPGNKVQAIEINDINRCEPCSAAANNVYPNLRAALKDYPVSGNRACLGRSRCRGHLRMIWR